MNRRSFLTGLLASIGIVHKPTNAAPALTPATPYWKPPTFSALGGEWKPFRYVVMYEDTGDSMFDLPDDDDEEYPDDDMGISPRRVYPHALDGAHITDNNIILINPTTDSQK